VVALEVYRPALGMSEVALIEVEMELDLALAVLSLFPYDSMQVEQVEAYCAAEDIELEEDGSEDIGLVVDQVVLVVGQGALVVGRIALVVDQVALVVDQAA